jgi:hypothetical protein
MKQIIFTETSSGDRTNIMSSFQLWSKESFLKQILATEKKYHGRYRYGYVDGAWVSLLKDMSLSEFEEVFSTDEIEKFTPEQITEFFRKEISEKYGEHKIKAAIKLLSKKELVKGTVYEDLQGVQYLYLGKGKLKIEQNPGYGKNELKEEKQGEVFSYTYGEKEFSNSDLTGINVIKGIKKLVKPIRQVALLDEYTYTQNKGWGRYNNTIYTLELCM